MRFSRFFLSLVAVLMLSACNGIVQNDPQNHGEFSNWMNGHPSKIEEWAWRMPTGYANQNVNKPTRAVTNAEGNVTTFVEETTVTTTETAQPPAELIGDATMLPANDGYGTLAQQVYFAHGSSRLTGTEKSALGTVARTVTPSTTVTVVGHASQRVDGVMDPVQKREINFTMAQKRADAVTRVLNDAGVSPAMVQSISRGDENASGNEDSDRRVDVYTAEGAPATQLTN